MNGIEKLITMLGEVGLISKPQDAEEKLAAEDIADMLWLLLHMRQKQDEQEIIPSFKEEIPDQSVQAPFPLLQGSAKKKPGIPPAKKESKPLLSSKGDSDNHVYLLSRHSSEQERQAQRGALFRSPGGTAETSPLVVPASPQIP